MFRALVLFLLSVAGAAVPTLTGELVVEGPLARRLGQTPADLVVLYAGEQKGSLDVCGCSTRPRGSMGRLASYVEATRSRGGALLVNPGEWLEDPGGFDGLLRPEALPRIRGMVEGVSLLGFDALNVTPIDLAGMSIATDTRGLPLVSANIEAPGVARWRVVEHGGLRVGITGIAAVEATLAQLPGVVLRPPESALDVVRAMVAEVDVAILLAWHAPEAARDLAKAIPELDVVIDANRHHEFVEPFFVGNAAWGWSTLDAMRVGELRLDLDQGRVIGGVDRHVDLDPQVPIDPRFTALQATVARSSR